METLATLNKKILGITLFVKERYPELYGFLGEMPDTLPFTKKPEITIEAMNAYYNSLLALVEKYSINYKINR